MKAAAWIAAASLSLCFAAPKVAEAGSCGGGGGSSAGGGSSGSGGSSGGGSSSSGTPTCTDTGQPLGFRECKPFGGWGQATRFPRFIGAMGMAIRQAPALGGDQTGHVSHDNESFTYRTVDSGGGSGGGAAMDTMVMATMRLGFGLPRPFYVAADVEMGGVTSAGPSAEMTTSGMRGTPTITQRAAIALNALGVVGARTRAGSGSLGLEVAGGVHYVSHTFHSQYLACEQLLNVSGMAPIVEVRATAERWLNPWVNVGAVVGGSVIDRGAWMTGVYVGVHTRAFASER